MLDIGFAHCRAAAALAERLAAVLGLQRPTWAVEPERFLDWFWFVSGREPRPGRLDIQTHVCLNAHST